MTPRISIVVPTYNREELIAEALNSLLKQSIEQTQYEVIVVNNNSTDGTFEKATQFAVKHKLFRVVTETSQGLSHARNRGYLEAHSDWIAYMDDDAKAYPNFVERILFMIDHFNFDCFGGVYLPWYKYGKPEWFKDDYASNGFLLEKPGLLEQRFLSGGIMVVKKCILEELGGFSSALGMLGTNVAYGEETNLQVKMRRAGYKIGFDPDLRIEHVVAKHKLNPAWFIKAEYARGKDTWAALERDITLPMVTRKIVAGHYQVAKQVFFRTLDLRHKNYSVENWSIDVIGRASYTYGQFIAGLRSLRC